MIVSNSRFNLPYFHTKKNLSDLNNNYISRLKGKWSNLGLQDQWFNDDLKGATTLLVTRLIFPILGFQKTRDVLDSEIRFNHEKNGIEIRMQGKFVLVKEKISNQFIFSKEGGGTIQHAITKKNWTYLGTNGLLPVDRWTHREFLPVVQLNSTQLLRLREHTNKSSIDNCFIQIVTVPRNVWSSPNSYLTGLKQNYKKNVPLHAYVRLIDKDGFVYSTGFGSTDEQDQLQNEMGYFSTINGMPTILDYEEFRPHKGRVTTTYPISLDRFNQTLNKIREDRRSTIRFNIQIQNCNTLAIKYLKTAGVDFPSINMSLRDIIYETLPDVLQFRKSREIFNKYTPQLVKLLVNGIYTILRTLIEYLISILILNPLFILYGINRSSKLTDRKSSEDLLIAAKRKIHLFSNAFDLQVDFSLKTIERQLSHSDDNGVTWVHSYNGPNLSIVPNQTNQVADRALLHQLQSIYSLKNMVL